MRSRRRRRETGSAAGVLCALVLLVFLITTAVVVTLNFRWIYYQDITWMDLEKVSGMNTQAIRVNYDALIDYNLLWNRAPLEFPTLPTSQPARIHFEEVKQIFDGIQIAWIVSAVMTVWILFATGGRRRWWLKWTGILGLVIPAALGALVAVGWDSFFVRFHELVFDNDYWLFDPATDPVILILPDGYFLQCAVMILVIVVLGSIVCIACAGRKRRKR